MLDFFAYALNEWSLPLVPEKRSNFRFSTVILWRVLLLKCFYTVFISLKI